MPDVTDRPVAENRDAQPMAPSQEGARAFLCDLGYLHPGEGGGKATPQSRDPTTRSNRLALLDLAGRMLRVFGLPARLAPGALFMGAESAPADFGISSAGTPTLSAGGRGVTLRAAFESCMGEAVEHLSLHSWGDEPMREAKLSELGQRQDGERSRTQVPDGEELAWMLAGLGLPLEHREAALDWSIMQSLDGEAQIFVPADLCLRRATTIDGLPLRLAESNGCAAGASLAAAQGHALLELIERDAVALWWYGGCPPGALELNAEGDAALADFLAALRQEEARRTWFLDLTSNLGLPVVAALSSEADGSAVTFGYGADLDPLAAAKSALLELCQMELARDLVQMKLEQRGPAALNAGDKAHLARAQELTLARYALLAPNPAARKRHLPRADGMSTLENCLLALRSAGLCPYWLDLTRPALGVTVARVLVPGLQSAKCDWVSPRLRETAARHGQGEARWPALPQVI